MKNKPKDKLYCGVDPEKIASADPEINVRGLYHFRDFVLERYRIHKRKDLYCYPAPWTDNLILRDFRFTNVRREHDKQTRYLIDNIIKNDELTLEDKIVNCFMFRCWNNWDTLKSFGFPYSAKLLYDPRTKENIRPLYKKLSKEDPGRLWWSNAYIQGGTKMAWRATDMRKPLDIEKDIPLRPFHVGVWLEKEHIVKRLLEAENQQRCFEVIKSIKGFAEFLAYQVFVDLTYIPEFPFSENEFVVAGPGCKRGLDLIFSDRDGMTYEECIFWLRSKINSTKSLFNSPAIDKVEDGKELTYNPMKLFSDLPVYDRKMNVMSIENCMCELSKYIKAIDGTGRPKNRYKGGM